MSEDAPLIPSPPEDLLAQADVRGGIRWWPADAAKQVIGWCERQQIAIVGVDLAYLRGDKTVATTEFLDASSEEIPEDWSSYVRTCAARASRFIESRCQEADAYFDLTTLSKSNRLGGDAARADEGLLDTQGHLP